MVMVKGDGKFGGASVAVAGDLPGVLLANGFCDGETEAGAFFGFVGLIETIEDFCKVVLRDGGAVV